MCSLQMCHINVSYQTVSCLQQKQNVHTGQKYHENNDIKGKASVQTFLKGAYIY